MVLYFSKYALADEFDTVNFIVSKSIRHETNLFRLSSNIDENELLEGNTGSEEIATTVIGLKINKLYSLQKFEIDANYIETNYRKFNYLSFGAVNYNGLWSWKLSPSLYGNLTRLHKEQQANYLDYRGAGNRNVTTVDVNRFDSTMEIDGAWKLKIEFAELEVNNERLIVQESDFKQRTLEIGVRRDFNSGSFLKLMTSQGRGEFFKRQSPSTSLMIDTGFTESRNELQVLWSVTAKSSIDARLAYIERKHSNFSKRDFNGGVGGLSWNWEITAKSALWASWQRTITSYQSLTSSYIENDTISIGSEWNITKKTALRARYDHHLRYFLGQGPQNPTLAQQDNIKSSQIALSWKPIKDLTLNLSLQSDERISNILNKNFKGKSGAISAIIKF